MFTALAWIRKSKGSEDDIGLARQRREVTALAEDIADEVDRLDLGVQTGFSSMTRDGDGLLDQRNDVQQTVDRLRTGEYDFLVAYDDRRVCRDDYFSIIEYAAEQGGCQFRYVADVADDDLTHDIKRRVERDTKEEEIEKARAAIRERQEKGYYLGRPPFGFCYDDDAKYLEPDPEEFPLAREVLRLRDQGATYDEIADRVDGVARSTAYNIVDRREQYEQVDDIKD